MWYVLQVAEGREDSICENCKKAFVRKEASQIFVPKYVWLKKVKEVRFTRLENTSPSFFELNSQRSKKTHEVLYLSYRLGCQMGRQIQINLSLSARLTGTFTVNRIFGGDNCGNKTEFNRKAFWKAYCGWKRKRNGESLLCLALPM